MRDEIMEFQRAGQYYLRFAKKKKKKNKLEEKCSQICFKHEIPAYPHKTMIVSSLRLKSMWQRQRKQQRY